MELLRQERYNRKVYNSGQPSMNKTVFCFDFQYVIMKFKGSFQPAVGI